MSILSTLNFLLVDDTKAMRSIINISLQSYGVTNITEAVDGLDALEKLEATVKNSSEPFHFIVSDLNMPRLNGIELLKKIRAHPNYHNIPFVLVTSENEERFRQQASNEGVDGYVLKPFDVDDLKEALTHAYNVRVSA